MTSNEVLQQINKSKKETERLTRKYESLFSNEQKELAWTCAEGDATNTLEQIVKKYVYKYFYDLTECQYIAGYSEYRPSTNRLFRVAGSQAIWEFSSLTDNYYNMYFASWWLKFNYKRIYESFFIKTERGYKIK